MARLFNHEFSNLDANHIQYLQTLQQEGCVYAEFWRDDIEDFGFCRIRLKPIEIVEFVEASVAFDEFIGLRNKLGDAAAALQRISNIRIRARVMEYNQWAQSIGQDTTYCFAAFEGKDLESLLCGWNPSRYEYLGDTYTGDRRFLLREILDLFPQSVAYLRNRKKNRPPFQIEVEQDVHDLLYAVVKCVFPDAKVEEFTPSHAGSSKIIDILIPTISTVIEAKLVRDETHAKKVADELKIDFESYHAHPNCNTLIAFVWDENNLVPDRINFVKELQGRREKNGRRFNVQVVIKP